MGGRGVCVFYARLLNPLLALLFLRYLACALTIAGCTKPTAPPEVVADTASVALDTADALDDATGAHAEVSDVVHETIDVPMDVSALAHDANDAPADVTEVSENAADLAQDATTDAADAALPWPDKLRFVIVADPQMGMTPAAEGPDLDKKLFQLAIAKIGALQPPAQFVLGVGDMVHFEAQPKLWADYLAVAATMPVPYHEVMGNHDGWNAQGLQHWRKTLGKLDYYAVVKGDVLLVALNSWFLKDPQALPAETQAHKDFLQATLQAHAATKYKFLFCHVPPFTKSAQEPDDYWNLPAGERAWLLGLLAQHGVTAVFTGHLHRTNVTFHGETLLLTTGPISVSMGSDPDGKPAKRGFMVVDLEQSSGTLASTFVPLVVADLPP